MEASMSDVVERLREYASPQWSVGAPAYVCTEAADEIERLREALQKIADAPAWGYPEKWETTPAQVRQLAFEALKG